MSIEVRVAEGNELKKWNDIVGSSPHGTIFHTLEWLKIVEKHTNSKLYPLIGLKESTIIGVFPLFYQKKFLIKSVFSPPPKVSVPYLGPIFVDYVNLKQSKKESLYMEFQRKVDEFMVSQIKPNYISISLPVGLLDSRPFLWSGYRVEPMYNYIIDLSNGVDHVWGQFKRNLRANIQGAEKKGAYVEEGSKRGLNHLYNFLVERYDEQGRIFPISKRYLLDICNSFHPQNLEIFVVKYDGEFVGGLIDLYYKNKAISWIGLPKSDLKGIYVNDLLQWDAIKKACESGLIYYEEAGANTPRLRHYKSKYNPDLLIYFSCKKYPSLISKGLERAYTQIFKPIYARFKLWR